MNRKRSIIISVTGIFIVLLILVGLTYGYFLTNINENTNTKSIEVTTANLIVDYGENTNVIQGINNAVPGYSVTKYFTATNNGNASVDYVATLDGVVNELTRQGDLEYTLTCASYLKSGFSLAANGTPSGDLDGTCNGTTATQFPSTTSTSIMVGNRIETTQVHYYVLTINYKEMGVDQSDDMNKIFSALVNIKDIKTIPNPYQSNTELLSYHIINNALTGANGEDGSKFVAAPLTKPAEETPPFYYIKGQDPKNYTGTMNDAGDYYITYADDYSINETTGKFTLINPTAPIKYSNIADKSSLLGKYILYPTTSSATQSTTNLLQIYQISKTSSEVLINTFKFDYVNKGKHSTEKVLSTTQDDYGTSYYFRGGVEDNFINFASMCWRIVRIEGNGNIKIILEDSTHECNSEDFIGNWTIGSAVAFGYDANKRANFLNYNGGLADAFKNYQETTLKSKIASTYSTEGAPKTIIDYLNIDEWCYDTATETDQEGNEYTRAFARIVTDNKPSLKCSGTKLTKFGDNETNMYVSALTADEEVFAGGTSNTINIDYYLYNYKNVMSNNFFFEYWTFSLAGQGDNLHYDQIFLNTGRMIFYDVDQNSFARSTVSLKSNIEILSGNGTIENPYVLK